LTRLAKYAVDSMGVGGADMNEPSVYVIERDAWSTIKGCDAHFRLTYEREFLPAQNLWRDFLVHSEETSLAWAV